MVGPFDSDPLNTKGGISDPIQSGSESGPEGSKQHLPIQELWKPGTYGLKCGPYTIYELDERVVLSQSPLLRDRGVSLPPSGDLVL